MIFTDYPGHLVAALLVMASAAVTFVTFRSGELRTPERRRYAWLLMVLHYATILALLVVLWNPSAWQTKPVFGRNAVLTIFDTSESMSVVDDGRQARLDKALERFNRCLDTGRTAGPQYKVYGFDDYAYYCGAPDLLRRWGSASNLHEAFALLAEQDRASPKARDSDTGAPRRSERGTAGTARPADSDKSESAPAAAQTDALAGVVILTDGQAGDKDLRRYLPPSRNDLPILLIGVGSRRPPPDVAVESLSAPAGAWIDTTIAVNVTVAATGLMNSPVTLELLLDGAVAGSREFSPAGFRSTGGKPGDVTAEFMVPARGLGAHVLTARVTPGPGEINLANNSRSTLVEVTQERPVQVLLYTQQASFDIGKIRQALAGEKRIHLDLGFDVIKWPELAERAAQGPGHTRLPETREAFYRYDVIILGPCDLNNLTATQRDSLYSFVAERGGGLLLLPGQSVTALMTWQDERAEALLPVLFNREYSRLWPPKPEPIRLTFEAQVGRVFDASAFADPAASISPFYQIDRVKPAATTLATAGNMPIATAQRLGRGRVCLLSASKLFTLYREDRQGGSLGELVCGLVAYLGRTPAQGAGVELFAERAAEDPRRVTFGAYVVDKSFQPVAGANVLLTVGEQVVAMEPTGRGYYRTTLDCGPTQSVVATAQAESNGAFLGERMLAMTLPEVRDEMSCVDLDEPFLRALAQRVHGRYLHIDEVSTETAKLFVAKHQTGVQETISSVWPRWPFLGLLCLLLSAGWFIRRATGLV
jgi:hypothetical protein